MGSPILSNLAPMVVVVPKRRLLDHMGAEATTGVSLGEVCSLTPGSAAKAAMGILSSVSTFEWVQS